MAYDNINKIAMEAPDWSPIAVPEFDGFGGILFNDNQVAFVSKSEGSHAIVSLGIASHDDVGVHDNQIWCALGGDRFGFNAAVLASTARVNGNCFKEAPGTVLLSALTMGMELNCTTANQSTHCVKVSGPANGTIDAHNVSALERRGQIVCGQKKELTGQVIKGGQGIAGVSVQVKGMESKTTTDRDGEFRLSVPKSEFTLVIRGPSSGAYSDFSAEISVPAEQHRAEIDIEAVPRSRR